MEKAMEKNTKFKFLMFENEANVCWLDASIALVAHNRTFKKLVEGFSESVINKIISIYDEAIMTFNDADSAIEQRKLKAQELLLTIQSSTQEHLKKFLKFKPGEPDSAFCALLNLIYQDKSNIKKELGISYKLKKQCSKCGSKSTSATKPIITFSKVTVFNPECPTSLYMCICKSEQEMKLIYKNFPPCLIFHFENGAGAGTNFPSSFSIKKREYHLTTIIILEKGSDPSLNHFVTWIRNPYLNLWLECNDLNISFATFSPVKPEFDLKDVYISVFEAFDDLGKITNDEISDQEQDEGCKKDEENVELVDISDEDDDCKNTDSSCKTLSDNVIKNDKNSNILQDSYSEGDISKKELLINDIKNKSATSMQNFKMHDNQKAKESVKSKSQNVFASNFKFPIKISPNEHETESKTFYSQEKADNESIETKDFRTEATDFLKHKIMESSEEKFSNLSLSNEASTMHKLGIHANEKSKEKSESHFNKLETEEKFNKIVDKSIEAKNSKLVIDNQVSLENKSTVASDENKKELFSPVNDKISMVLNSDEKSSNVSSQNNLIHHKFPNKISLAKDEAKSKPFDYQYMDVDEFTASKELKADFVEHKITEVSVENEEIFSIKRKNEAESKNVDCQNKVIGKTVEAKNSILIMNQSIPEHKDVNTSDENKNDLSHSVNNKHKNKRFKESQETENVNIDIFIANPKCTRNYFVGKDETEAKSKNFNFQDDTSNCLLPKSAEKRERAEDKYVGSSERKTKTTDDKYISSNKDSKSEMFHNEASYTLQTQETNEENIKLKGNVADRCKAMVPSVVERTFAAFLQRIIEIRENKLKNEKSDSAT